MSQGKTNSERIARMMPPLMRSFPYLLSAWVKYRRRPMSSIEMYASLEMSMTTELTVVSRRETTDMNCCARPWITAPMSGG